MGERLLFFDFDRTLYSYESWSIPQSARESLLQLQAQGDIVVIATGRAPGALDFIRDTLNIPFRWMIAMNGQILYDGEQKVFEHFITLSSLAKIFDVAQQNGFAYGGFYSEGNLVNCINERVEEVWTAFHAPLPTPMPNFLEKRSLYHGHLYITQEEADRFFSPLLEDYLTNWSHPTLMNLISKETGKSEGISWLTKRYGIKREDTYAFGDGFNDKDMLLSVGHGVAMGNAADDLKAVAEYVAPLPDEDGIRKALIHYGLIG